MKEWIVLPKIMAMAMAASTAMLSADFDQGKGSVEFHATGHPSAIKIVGKGSAPHGTFLIDAKQITGEARFDLASLDTGIEIRNHHMKEKYLEVDKYPQAKLVLSPITISRAGQDDFTLDQVPFTGTLSLHGKEHPVSGTAHIEKKGNQISMTARFSMKVADYAISIPSFAGITMADEVEITITETVPAGKATPL